MANQTLARAKQPPDKVPSEAEYQAFCAALGASARGRAFLAEYARRNRHADTKVVLAALTSGSPCPILEHQFINQPV